MGRARVRVVPAKFSPGQLIITPGCIEAFHRSGHDSICALLIRHVCGDWGDLDAHDREVNEYALLHGQRLLSAYTLSNGTKIWVITDGDRSVTTFLLPEEY
jgi:hypothetical protein